MTFAQAVNIGWIALPVALIIGIVYAMSAWNDHLTKH